MDAQHMLSNAGTASQHQPLVDDPVVQGAILRSILQWIEACEDGDIDFLKWELRQHPNFNS